MSLLAVLLLTLLAFVFGVIAAVHLCVQIELIDREALDRWKALRKVRK